MYESPCVSSNEEHKKYEARCKRDMQEDLKEGIDIIFEFKKSISKLHPGATESILRLIRDGHHLI